MSKTRQAVVALVICVLSVACLISLCRPQCKRPTLGSWLGISGPSFSWPSIPSAPSLQTANCKLQTSLFGPSDDQLRITVPPNKDTVRILVDEKLRTSILSPQSSVLSPPISVLRRHSLIRFRPSLHLCVLAPLSSLLSPHSFGLALKLRPVELGRFGLAGYAGLSGLRSPVTPVVGIGLDYRLIGNLSFDSACLWGLQTANCKLQTASLYLGLSLRL
jgi:hypothetical protein